MNKAYEVITDRIIQLLEKGTVPWHKPWGGEELRPRSLATERNYRGINAFLLSAAGYGSPYWLTFRQANERGGSVSKGERGYPCVYWNWLETVNEDTKEKSKKGFLKYYTVFNVEQCKDIPYPKIESRKSDFEPIAECEKIVVGMPNPPALNHGGIRACYSPLNDTVHMPKCETFDKPESYYAILFHEMVHSTGHKSRLDRKGVSSEIVFGSPTYCSEELVAEMGATYLCGHASIENKIIDNSASYIDVWLSRIRKDGKILIQSASQAQKAADYILCGGGSAHGEQ